MSAIRIHLTNGGTAKINKEDSDLSSHRWTVYPGRSRQVTTVEGGGKHSKYITLWRCIWRRLHPSGAFPSFPWFGDGDHFNLTRSNICPEEKVIPKKDPGPKVTIPRNAKLTDIHECPTIHSLRISYRGCIAQAKTFINKSAFMMRQDHCGECPIAIAAMKHFGLYKDWESAIKCMLCGVPMYHTKSSTKIHICIKCRERREHDARRLSLMAEAL